jgi:hypothetical protein
MHTWNAGQILTVIRTVNKMDIDYLGPDESSQNQMLIQFMNVALWKLARLCFNTEVSDTLTISGDGPVTFQKGQAAIANMFEPLRIVDVSTGSEMPKRPAFTSARGWYCEGPNQPIDIRGFTGDFQLHYIRYPRQVTQASDPVDCPETGYQALIAEISAMVKDVKNFYDESAAMEAKAKAGYSVIEQAAQSARGPSSGGLPPSFRDVDRARGG